MCGGADCEIRFICQRLKLFFIETESKLYGVKEDYYKLRMSRIYVLLAPLYLITYCVRVRSTPLQRSLDRAVGFSQKEKLKGNQTYF